MWGTNTCVPVVCTVCSRLHNINVWVATANCRVPQQNRPGAVGQEPRKICEHVYSAASYNGPGGNRKLTIRWW
jgi:hypothetical protein